MKKSQWDDNEIKDLLSKMPEVQDRRDPKTIYANAMKTRSREKKSRSWILYTGAAAALLFFSVFISSNFLQQSTHEQNSGGGVGSQMDDRLQESADKNSEFGKSGFEIQQSHEEEPGFSSLIEKKPSLLFQDDLQNRKYITISLPALNNRYTVPFTFLSDKGSRMDIAELTELQLKNIRAEGHNIEPFYPEGMDLVYDEGNRITVLLENLPAQWELTARLLEESFRYKSAVEKMSFQSGDDNLMDPDLGNLPDELNIKHVSKRAIFVLEQPSYTLYVPSINEYPAFQEALMSMKNWEDEQVRTSIPAEIDFRVSEENDTAIIHFEEPLQNDKKNIIMVEAILLTAREFGFSHVRFENSGISKIGAYEIDQEMDVPAAPNVIGSIRTAD